MYSLRLRVPIPQIEPVEQPRELPFEWAMRLLALRKRGLVGVLYCEAGVWSIATSEYAPYATREWYSIPRLMKLIETLEALPDRKPVGTEHEALEAYRRYHNERNGVKEAGYAL